MQKSFSLKKLYFTLISIAGIIGIMFGYGTLIYSLVNNAIITDQEYIAGSYSYEIKECDNPYTKPEGQAPKTPVEIQKCKDDATQTILQRRVYDRKTSIINGIVRGTLFLILFVTHFPIMMRKEKEIL
ncbi:MAG: hypothetical protein WAZ12_00990 [Candidatus Absconditicoccaceae bacterium]